MVRLLGAPEAWSRTCISLLSLNRGYNYGMMNVIERRPFSELGDQQLLEQTRRLAANQRCIDVHILDHLERDRPARSGAAARVLEPVRLRGAGAALLRRRRAAAHPGDAAVPAPWVGAGQPAERRVEYDVGGGSWKPPLPAPNGPSARAIPGIGMSVRIAATIRTTIALAEPRQLGLPAAPGEADEQGQRGHRSAPGFAPPAGECSGDVRERGHRSAPRVAPPAGECTGDVAAGNTPAVPVASRSGAQAPGAGHAGALLPADGVERKRVAVSGALLRSRCCSRCRPRLRRAVIGRRPCSTTSAADEFLGVDARARTGHGSSGVAAHRFARARNHSGMIRLRSCRPARCRRPRCYTRSASAS